MDALRNVMAYYFPSFITLTRYWYYILPPMISYGAKKLNRHGQIKIDIELNEAYDLNKVHELFEEILTS